VSSIRDERAFGLPLCAQRSNSGQATIPRSRGFQQAVATKGVFALRGGRVQRLFLDPQRKPLTRVRQGLWFEVRNLRNVRLHQFRAGDPFREFQQPWRVGFVHLQRFKVAGTDRGVRRLPVRAKPLPLTGSSAPTSGSFVTYLVGPRLNWRKFDHFVPFGEFLVGGTTGSTELTGTTTQSAFATAAGGGVDMVLTKNLAWRFAQLDT